MKEIFYAFRTLQEGIMSAIIVMSNDRVVPHDVTTKDDLFYQITCNYSESRSNKINKGSVLGGLSPIAIHSTQAPRNISLQIMKKGRAVDSVLIGETLTARVESTFPGVPYLFIIKLFK
uniref:Uncharacterized protein n=1 Tax=Heterorhabditis bacteriophora TaxID=37862 RepID=A0A1I7X2V8_HETBA